MHRLPATAGALPDSGPRGSAATRNGRPLLLIGQRAADTDLGSQMLASEAGIDPSVKHQGPRTTIPF